MTQIALRMLLGLRSYHQLAALSVLNAVPSYVLSSAWSACQWANYPGLLWTVLCR